MPLNVFRKIGSKCEYCLRVPNENRDNIYNLDSILKIASKTNGKYNCLIPVSGGRDSAFVLYYAKKNIKIKSLGSAF